MSRPACARTRPNVHRVWLPFKSARAVFGACADAVPLTWGARTRSSSRSGSPRPSTGGRCSRLCARMCMPCHVSKQQDPYLETRVSNSKPGATPAPRHLVQHGTLLGIAALPTLGYGCTKASLGYSPSTRISLKAGRECLPARRSRVHCHVLRTGDARRVLHGAKHVHPCDGRTSNRRESPRHTNQHTRQHTRLRGNLSGPPIRSISTSTSTGSTPPAPTPAPGGGGLGLGPVRLVVTGHGWSRQAHTQRPHAKVSVWGPGVGAGLGSKVD